MTLLGRYLLKEQLRSVSLVLFVLLMVYLLLALIGELDDLGNGNYSLLKIGQYLLMVMPRWIFDLLPGAALLGSLLALGNLAGNSELIAMRAAGYSVWKVARSTLIGATVLVAFGILVGEVLAPPLEQMGRDMRSSARAGSVGAAVKSGVWLRDGNTFIRIDRMESPELLNVVDIFQVDEQRRLQSSSRAEWARFDGERWSLENVRRTTFNGEAITTEVIDRQLWENQFDPGLLDLFVIRPDSFSSLELVEYVRFLDRNELDSRRYRAALWHRLGSPLAILAMAMLAVPFVLGSLRGAGIGQRMVIGLLIGFAFFGLRQTLERTGVVYGLDPIVTGLAPSLILMAITAALIRRQG